MEKSIVNELLGPQGGGIERILEESPAVAFKRKKLASSINMLKEAKDVVANIMDRIVGDGESSILEKSLNPELDSVGVRVPDSDFIRLISRGSGSALALTSANLSGKPSSVCVKDFENLWEHCAYVYDGGELPSGRAGSTVVDLSKPGKFKILRPGSAKEETVAILGKYSLVEEAI